MLTDTQHVSELILTCIRVLAGMRPKQRCVFAWHYRGCECTFGAVLQYVLVVIDRQSLAS